MAVEPLASPIQVEHLDGDSVWLVRLARPKANVVDAAMTNALRAVFAAAQAAPALKAVVLSSSGPHFSFGASVQEHLPDQVLGMLRGFHGLFRAIGEAAVPVFAAVRGQCLGGGLELAAFCHRLFAAPDSKFGQPEIQLGVFAPVASLLLPERIGRAAAEDLCLTGRTVDAAEAMQLGLCDAVVEDPEQAALGHARERLCPHSASSLRHAVRAVRGPFLERFLPQLAELERIYVNDLMATHDAREGIEAFLAKRAPVWRNA